MLGSKLISVLSVAGLLTLSLSTAEGLLGGGDAMNLISVNGRYIGIVLNIFRSYFLSSLLWSSSWCPGVLTKESRYRTAYACEGRQLRISCEQPNTIIHLLRANYGRFSISICNEHGNLDWSVDCTSAASFFVIKETCSLKNNCSLSASPALFGDPCPGTPKYLEAHYQCIPEKSSGTPVTSTVSSTSSSTSTSRPPIIIPVTRNVRPYIPLMVTDGFFSSSTTTTKSSSLLTTQVTTSSLSQPYSSPPQPLPIDDQQEEYVTTVVPPPTTSIPNNSQDVLVVSKASRGNDIILFVGETSTQEPSTVHLSRWSPGNGQEEEEPQVGVWCSPIMFRGLYWNWTRGGHVAVHRCPNGGIGRAKWRCDLLTVQWTPDAPDLSDCTSLWVDNIKYRISRGDPVTTLAAELAVITKTKTLMPGDIVHTADILHRLVAEMAERVRDIEDPLHRQRLLLALMETVLEVCSNLLEDSQRLPWHDLSQEQQQKSAAALLRSQERSGWLLAESHHSRYSMQSGQPHVLAAVNVVESGDISDIVLPPPQDTWWLIEDRLMVPAPSLQATAKQGVSRLVLLVHNRLGDLLGTEIYPLSSADTNVSLILNSRVIGALLEGHRVLSLPRPITVTFRHLQVENVSNPMCVFWDYQIRSWSTLGCWLKYSNRTHTACQCSHLTNLAIIMQQSDSQDQPVSSDPLTLRMLVYIGCAVAMLFLLVTIVILQFVSSLRTERVTIHKHLCLCLFLAEVALIGGLEQTEEPRACSVLAGVLHYLLLAAFAWAFLDSFHLYILLGDSENQHDRWRTRWYTCVAYGIPLVVVAISALIDPASYGTETYCWLRVDNYYVFSFGGPAIACALASVLFLCLTVGRVCAQRNSALQVKNKDQSKLSAVSKWSGEATILLLILCSTWTLLPLFLHRERPLTAYFFLALNSLQGLVVFIFYCIGGDKIPGTEEPPGPVWWCPCLKQTQRRRSHHHHLYSPTSTNCQPHSVGTPLSPTPHHLHHVHHNLTTPPPCTQVVFPERRCPGGETCEEHPLQYLIRSPESTWRRQQQLDDERALCCYRSACGPAADHHHHHHYNQHIHQQAPEPHYETLEPQEDSGVDLQPPRPLFSSLAAVLNNVGSVGVHSGSSCASPCHVAYSGIQSPTDSDPSSSFDCHRMMASSTPSSTGNDATDSLPDLDHRVMVGHHPVGIPASQTY